jgi:hypothetical protein
MNKIGKILSIIFKVWIWYVKLKFYTMYIIGVLLSLFSITLIYNEFYINESFDHNSLIGWIQLDSGYILI